MKWPPEERDFRNFVAYMERYHPENSDPEMLWEAYKKFYSCQCESCKTRRRLGIIPIGRYKHDCTAPLRALSNEDINVLQNT